MMKTILICLLMVGWASGAAAGITPPDELLIRFAPEVGESEIQSIIEDAGASEPQRRYAPRHWLARVSVGDVFQVLDTLLAEPDVEVAELNYEGAGGYVPGDTLFGEQWHLKQDSGVDIDATRAWDLSRGSDSIVIAVLDSGIKLDQPEFAGRLAKNASEIPNNFADDDGNGLVDDVQGWDFVAGDNDPNGEHGHGTWVSSAMAANADDRGVAGVDHRAQILPLQVLNAENRGATADLIDAIYYAADQGADILNMSLINYPESQMIGDALDAAAARGAILMACAGNGGQNTADSQYPGAHPRTLSIGSTTRSDSLAGFSSTGETVDFAAPGDAIVVATHTAPYEADDREVHNGCSLATPIAAGVVSLMLSVRPDLTQAEVETLLAQSAIDLGAPGWDEAFGWGRIDAEAAVRTADTLFAGGFEG